ncbi:MAG TPA: DUF429 domain-containing protein [Micromonosporaceae bacterium]
MSTWPGAPGRPPVWPWLAGPCLVAFDAPLVVNNASGARECERLVDQYFRRYHAGCHPSNRGMPQFQDGGRAHRIARVLSLEVDPRSTAAHDHPEVQRPQGPYAGLAA